MAQDEVNFPDIPGVLFKDVNWVDHYDLLIGKCSPMFNENGKMTVKWVSFNPDTKKVVFDVLSGDENFVGKRWEAEIEPRMPFYACTEEAVSLFLSIV